MKTSERDPKEVLSNLRPYYKAQKVILIIQFFHDQIATGELVEIGVNEESVTITSDDSPLRFETKRIKSIVHSRVYEGKLMEAA